jgi:hypothetical protein
MLSRKERTMGNVNTLYEKELFHKYMCVQRKRYIKHQDMYACSIKVVHFYIKRTFEFFEKETDIWVEE